jgi:hypothetical protein
MASLVHKLPKSKFTNLPQRSDSRSRVLEELQGLPGSLLEARRPFGVASGLLRRVAFYNEEAEQQIPPSAVIVHLLR